MKSSSQRKAEAGFTLVELLIVISLIAFLISALGMTIGTLMANAREAATIATIRKIDGILTERMQGLERVFGGADFRKFVDRTHEKLLNGDPVLTGGTQLYGLSRKATETLARKEFAREFFPQRFAEMSQTSGAPPTRPIRIQTDEIYGATGSSPVNWAKHNPETESAELLYFAVTRMDVFGAAPVDTGAFRTQEVADTDGDGLPEFVDGWGKPLRFYRWPTRLFRPYGVLGQDKQPGAAGVNDDDLTGMPPRTPVDGIEELGWPTTDDTLVAKTTRQFAALYFLGLPRSPVTPPIPGDYDLLNEDPDDAYGVLIAEVKRLQALGIPMLSAVNESRYHSFDTFHKPLIVSAGPDGVLGLLEPNVTEDANLNGSLDSGEDTNGNTFLDIGYLAQPVSIPNENAFDDITNRNRRAGN